MGEIKLEAEKPKQHQVLCVFFQIFHLPGSPFDPTIANRCLFQFSVAFWGFPKLIISTLDFWTNKKVDLGDETRLFGRLSGPASPCRHCKCRLAENSPSVKSEISQTSWSKGLAEPLLQVGSMILMILMGFCGVRPTPQKNKAGGGG